ncbi:DUF4129 domain-containing protein [Rhizohabitans arisaemae]|uniref:DUF4129 domain-containing protein n=1 Tax=Rhizohabitans arisaemae TaxID=2720610 RepID=UPI0024B078E4|nr:DUF4129 domain-containing protein [Rhizohabitans arisaemae]
MNPIGVGRDEAAEAARRELAKLEYQEESWLDHTVRRFRQYVEDLLAGEGETLLDSTLALVALLLVLVGLVALIRWRIGKTVRARRRAEEGLYGERALTSAEHRAEAERLAAEGRWPEAIGERLRAMARALEERAILTPSPSRTAGEFATEAGRELPGLAEELTGAARIFDDVVYGGRAGTAEAYGRLADLDGRLARTRSAV